MTSLIQNIAKARALTIGLGLLATSAPVFAQAAPAPGAPITPPVPKPATPAPAVPAPAVPAPVAPAAVVPTTDPQAKALLDQVVERYGTLKSLTVSDNDGQNTDLIQFSAPQTAKVTTTNAKGKLVAVQIYNGTDRIVMQKPNDVYEFVSKPLAPIAPDASLRSRVSATGVGGPLVSSMLAGISPFREDGPFKASSYTMGQPTMREGLLLTPIVITTVKPEKRPTDLSFTLFVDPQTRLVHVTEVVATLPDGKKQTYVDTFKNIQVDTDIPATTFVLVPTAEIVKVDKFSDPVARAKVGAPPQALPVGTKDINGKEITFDQFKGKVTLVDFWATWCGPCKEELPNVKANYAKYHDKGFEIVGISLDQTTDPLTKYIKEKDMPWRQVWDGFWSGPIADSFNVKSIPQTILIGKDGKIISVSAFVDNGTPEGLVLGPMGKNLEPAIKAALAAG